MSDWTFTANIFENEPSIIRGDEPIKTKVQAHEFTCADCQLDTVCHSPKLSFIGDGEKGVLIIGSHPSKEEDIHGELGHGEEFEFLQSSLKEEGINLLRDAYYVTAIGCRTPRNRTPNGREVSACHKRLKKFIAKLNPHTIVLLGPTPFQSIIYPRLTGRIKGTEWNKFCGDVIPDQELNRFITVTWPVSTMFECKEYEDGNKGKPLYQRDEAWYRLWKSHIVNAFNKRSFYKASYIDSCLTTIDVDIACEWIQDALSWDKCSFDYETTGRKPHRKGHRIVCASISDGAFAYSFPFFNDPVFRKLWKKLMESNVKKIAHNGQFEWLWSYVIAGYWPKNLFWDTMLGQHCVNNQKPTGLKYCVYTKFGSIGYDDSIDGYLEAPKHEEKKHGANAFNLIDRAPMEDLLLYNALDSLYTYKLYEMQYQELTPEQREGAVFLFDSSITLVECQANGVRISQTKFNKAKEEAELYLAELKQKVMEDDEVKQWDMDYPFNLDSTQDCLHLFIDILKYKPIKYTEKTKKPAMDKEFLEKSNTELTRKIMAYRGMSKLLGTYISQYTSEMIDNRVHPYFNLNRVDTYRSSSSEPNIQNVPKRDMRAKKILRSFIIPNDGCRIAEYDYQALEVAINACYSGDKNMIRYITSPGSDMHRDAAVDCYMMPPEKITKEMRNSVKGDLNFAFLYGSYYAQVAPDLWESVHSLGLVDHMASKGIRTFQDFEKHVETIERIFWEKRFPEHDEWRKKQWKDYQKRGYLTTYTGFKLYGPMSRNNSFNGCVQGSGYHVLQWTMNQVSQKFKRLEYSEYMGEIHDSQVICVHPVEEDMIDYWVWLYGTQKVVEHWPWISVPLRIEKDSSEVDGSWSEMTGRGFVKGE